MSGEVDETWPSHVNCIPRISTPKSSGSSGATVMLNTEAMAVGGPSPGAVEWLHHQACFAYAAPSEHVEKVVEQAFRLCRYDAHCAAQELYKSLGEAGAQAGAQGVSSEDSAGLGLAGRVQVEGLLAWWCRRAWEDRRIKEAADAVKRQTGGVERAAALSSYCRFAATAKKVARQACQISGGQQDLLRAWQRCRQSRGWPREAARRLEEGGFDPASAAAREDCCGDARCLAALWELQELRKEAGA